MSDELKPCPFCGGENVTNEFDDPFYYVICGICGASSAFSDEEGAVRLWNTRAALTDEQFSLAVHDGEAWQRVQECHIRYHGGMVSEGGMEAEDWYYCDACGEELPKWAQDAWSEYADFDFEGAMPFRHCPECGAKVVTC